MKKCLCFATALICIGAGALAAPNHQKIVSNTVDLLVLPAAESFSQTTNALAQDAQSCEPGADLDPLRAQYQASWDAWMALDLYNFGPLEDGSKAIAIAFWPDKKGFTRRTLKNLIANKDPVVDDPDAFAGISVAGRGFFALERLLYGDDIAQPAPAEAPDAYDCRLIGAIATDLHRTAAAIEQDWRDNWAGILKNAGAPDNARFHSDKEVTQLIYTALDNAIETTLDMRLARPMGEIDKPHPRQAEAWRSGRSLANIGAQLAAIEQLYKKALREQINPLTRQEMDVAIDYAIKSQQKAASVGTLAAAVSGPERIKIDILAAAISALQVSVDEAMGPELGVVTGFNNRDGD